jgi:hypothetical protein
VAWAAAASAAHQLGSALVRTAIVPEVYRAQSLDRAELDRAAANAAAAILLGDELGLSPIAALRSVYVIKGAPAMYTRTMVALVLSRGHRMWTESETHEAVTVAGHRAGDPEHVERSTWTIARARAEGYTRNNNYREHPAAMLYARAAADVARRVAPDVLLGVPETPAEELGPLMPGGALDGGADTPDSRVVRRAGGKPRTTGTTHPALGTVRAAPAPGVSDEDEPTGPPGEVPGGDVSAPRDVTGADVLPDAAGPADGDDDPPNEDVEPLVTSAQRATLHVGFKALGLDRDGPNGYVAAAGRIVGRTIDSTSELTVTEASAVIEAVNERRRRLTPPPADDEPESTPEPADDDTYRGPR